MHRDKIEVPFDHSMSAGDWGLAFPGIPRATDVTFSINLDPKSTIHVAGTSILRSFDTYYNGTSFPAFRLVNARMTGGTMTTTWRGFVTDMNLNVGQVQGVMSSEVTIALSDSFTVAITT